MKKYIVKYERILPCNRRPVYEEQEIQAINLKHAKKLARERLGKYTIDTMRLVDVTKVSD